MHLNILDASNMYTINKKFDIILTYSPGINEITGHIFECFDYYLVLKTKYKVGILFFQTIKFDYLKIAFENKYNVDFNSVVDDIIIINSKTLLTEHIYNFGQSTITILTDGNINSLFEKRIYIISKKILCFLCNENDTIKQYQKNNIVYLQDYRIYGKNKSYVSFNYVKKIPFNFYHSITGM